MAIKILFMVTAVLIGVCSAATYNRRTEAGALHNEGIPKYDLTEGLDDDKLETMTEGLEDDKLGTMTEGQEDDKLETEGLEDAMPEYDSIDSKDNDASDYDFDQFVETTSTNNFDGPLSFKCPREQAIHRVKSQYSGGHRDRKWQFYCKNIKDAKCINCEISSGYATQLQQHIAFNCPPNQVLAGVESVHNNGKEDRVWKFRCCENFQHVTTNCELTDYINTLGSKMDHTAREDKVVVGIHSYWRSNDRQWKLMVCNFDKKCNNKC